MDLAIIPGRSGSKSILRKNLIKLDRKETLMERTMRVAKSSGIFSKIIVSTDIEFILDGDYPGFRLYKRPKELCQDDSLMNDVVLDVLNKFKVKDRDTVWLLQPTSPFRKQKHFKEIHSIFKRESIKSLISIVNVGAHHPNRMYTKKGNSIYHLRNTGFVNKQDLRPIYLRNGAFYVIKAGYEAFD